jgi:hypothetical protein
VKDCGCFGDALKLKPWESFMKDVVLLFFIFYFIQSKLVKPVFANSVQNIITYASIICMFLGVWVLNHLPLIDFRPFKVANIQKKEVPEGAKSVVEMTFIYNVNGVNTEFSTDDLMNLPEGATLWIEKIK